MRKRSQKISKVVALATSEERKLGAATGASSRKLQEQVSRLGELNAYRHNYAERCKFGENISAAHWKDHQTFLQRLDRAVKSQQQIIRDSEQNLEIHRRRWLAKRQRQQSLQRVLDSYRAEEQLHDERREQREMDDLPAAQELYPNEGD